MTDPSMAIMNYMRNSGKDIDADFLQQLKGQPITQLTTFTRS